MSQKDDVILFATGNRHKFEEARHVLSGWGITISLLNKKGLEIQSDDVEEIARVSVLHIAREQLCPAFVEDAGLFIRALNGFPGSYSSFVYRTIGTSGILKLMLGVVDREAEFRSVVAFCGPGDEPRCFSGVVCGRISMEERGSYGFGFDPIFEPVGGSGRTFAEMMVEEKNRFSHRAGALRKFAGWYRKRFK